MQCTKISPEFDFGVKEKRSRSPRTKTVFFSGAVLAGALRVVYVCENVVSIAGVAGVAVGHSTTSASK